VPAVLLPLAAFASETEAESRAPGESPATEDQAIDAANEAAERVAALPAAGAKTDRVVMRNGDHLTGEVKKLERGKLRFKTDATDTIDVDWEDVSTVTSSSYFEIETSEGARYFGSMPPASEPGKVKIAVGNASAELEQGEIVLITPIKKTFWARVDGSVSAGFSFTKSSDITQLNFGSNAKYRAERYMLETRLDANLTRQGEEEAEDSQRGDLTFTYRRFRKDRWFTEWNGAAQRNDELGLDLRLIAGWSMGRAAIRTNHALLSLVAGLAINQEWRSGGEPSAVNLELPLSANYDLFFYSTPKTDLKSGLTLYIGITDWGRNRVEQNLSFRREFIKDLFWDISTYVSYDSRPPESANSSIDYGIVSSLGYSF
jgi:hypothetical protein